MICGPCSRIRDGRTPGVAVWRWWTHEGRYSNDLCESCCGWWLLGCIEDGDMTPYAVELLMGATL